MHDFIGGGCCRKVGAEGPALLLMVLPPLLGLLALLLLLFLEVSLMTF